MSNSMNEINPTKRFSVRAEYYNKYRPGYPAEILQFLESECRLAPSSVIADVGSGTGILSRLFLDNGNMVYGVEPNKEMRDIAEELMSGYPNFKSVNGAAELTTLEKNSVDFITAGQAFHWFDVDKSKKEFQRIVISGGWVVLLWNDRRTDATPFLRAYEDMLLKFATDYAKLDSANFNHKNINRFFSEGDFRLKVLNNSQVFNYESLKGRLLSMSYVPMEGHPNYKPMMKELARIFNEWQKDGKVVFEYDTKMYYGRIE